MYRKLKVRIKQTGVYRKLRIYIRRNLIRRIFHFNIKLTVFLSEIVLDKILNISLIISLIIIFDHPLANFIFGKVNLIKSFLEHNYIEKESFIWMFYFLFILILFRKYRKQVSNLSKIVYNFTGLIICVYYWYIRKDYFQIGDYYFSFSNFSTISFKYLDFFFGSLALYNFFQIIKKFAIYFNSFYLTNKSIWENDKPIDENIDFLDIYNRTILARNIATQINNFYDLTNSFSIGIVGSWGSGKSTFLNQIKRELKGDSANNKSNLIINFNPWQYPDAANLTKAFLREVEIKIQKHYFIDNYISDYINQLFKNNKSLWSVFINAIFQSKSIESIHKSIKDSIRKSEKRLIIFIDDIDRLQSNEVYEILTIIRNIGDLPNTIFILAYDKDYLVKTLKGKIKEPQEYLSKFFQTEFELSKILTDTLKLNLFDQIDKAFPDLNFSNEMLSKSSQKDSDFKGNYNLEGLTLLKNQRDIIKIMNALKIIWPIIKSEILFSDFLKIEILRLKYCNVYSKIKNKDPEFINLYGNTYVFTSNTEVRNIPRTDKTFIQQVNHDLPKNINSLIPDNNDREEIIKVLKSLFPVPIQRDQNDINISSNDNDSNERAVRNNSIFDFYFQNDITIKELTDLR